MTREEAVKRANEVREGIEKDVDDLTAHFDGIYGEDENGNWIVGYGVSGSANIVVTPDRTWPDSSSSFRSRLNAMEVLTPIPQKTG